MLLSRLALIAPLCLAVPSFAATLCVSTNGTPGCYTHIADAVAAASAGDTINVSYGTYFEGIKITKPLSLVGNGNGSTILDASGLMQGIRVDGIAAPGLARVNISGFTVQNANLEGILVLNASNVTVSSNVVINNNKALVNGVCSMLPPEEPGEAQDCGEGVHLQAVDHSIVTANTIQGNAGGILISDDTGTTHDNLISFNIVSDNPFACGITMASHIAALSTGATVPFGVYHNTIYGNRSQRNGKQISGGAGIGIFASVPSAKTYANVVVDNLVTDNGHPGIAMHAHAPFQSLNDNMVVGNTVVNNGADTADAATPGPTGINLYSLTPVTGNIIADNSIQGESYAVVIKNPAPVEVHFNALLGSGPGVDNLGVGLVNAAENWWSCPSGPTIPGSCSMAVGSSVIAIPWLTSPIPSQPNY